MRKMYILGDAEERTNEFIGTEDRLEERKRRKIGTRIFDFYKGSSN